MLYLAIALGGGAGSLARYGLARFALRAGAASLVGTLAANVLGAFLLGLLLRSGAVPAAGGAAPSALRLALTVGFCGGFTTFSTFSAETVALLQAGQHARALLYVGASVVLSLAAVAAGLAVPSAPR